MPKDSEPPADDLVMGSLEHLLAGLRAMLPLVAQLIGDLEALLRQIRPPSA